MYAIFALIRCSFINAALTMPKYELHYFNGRGRGEVCRLLFVAAGQAFTDTRVEQAEWPKLKPSKYSWQIITMIKSLKCSCRNVVEGLYWFVFSGSLSTMCSFGSFL